MLIDPTTLSRRDKYKLITHCVVPRPIGWLSTCDAQGRPNLAPFSFFNAVCTDPPTVVVGVGRRSGARKDTAANLLDTGEAVVHIVGRPMAEAMVKTAAEVAPEIDEFELAGLTAVASERVQPPRVREAAIAMEARVSGHHTIGHAPMDVFFLEVLLFHADDAVLAAGVPDREKLAAVGRMGGSGYCESVQNFELTRPDQGTHQSR